MVDCGNQALDSNDNSWRRGCNPADSARWRRESFQSRYREMRCPSSTLARGQVAAEMQLV